MSQQPVDIDGAPVVRTKERFPKNFSPFVVWRGGPNEAATDTIYSDALFSEETERMEQLWDAHCSDRRWDRVPIEQIESFLRELKGNPQLKVIVLAEYCHRVTHNPLWRVDYSA